MLLPNDPALLQARVTLMQWNSDDPENWVLERAGGKPEIIKVDKLLLEDRALTYAEIVQFEDGSSIAEKLGRASGILYAGPFWVEASANICRFFNVNSPAEIDEAAWRQAQDAYLEDKVRQSLGLSDIAWHTLSDVDRSFATTMYKTSFIKLAREAVQAACRHVQQRIGEDDPMLGIVMTEDDEAACGLIHYVEMQLFARQQALIEKANNNAYGFIDAAAKNDQEEDVCCDAPGLI